MVFARSAASLISIIQLIPHNSTKLQKNLPKFSSYTKVHKIFKICLFYKQTEQTRKQILYQNIVKYLPANGTSATNSSTQSVELDSDTLELSDPLDAPKPGDAKLKSNRPERRLYSYCLQIFVNLRDGRLKEFDAIFMFFFEFH